MPQPGNDIGQAVVGFLIQKSPAGNIIEVKGMMTNFVSLLSTSIKMLGRYYPSLFPTSSHDAIVRHVYNKLVDMLEHCKDKWTHVTVYFHEKVGSKGQDGQVVGKFGIGERRNRGQALLDYAARYHL